MDTKNQETVANSEAIKSTGDCSCSRAAPGSRLQVGCKIVRGGHIIEVVDVSDKIVRYEKTMEMANGIYETETVEVDFDTFDEQVSFTIFHGAQFIPANKENTRRSEA
jgi:hypothetical protein